MRLLLAAVAFAAAHAFLSDSTVERTGRYLLRVLAERSSP
jgi:hypothetical protein